MMHRILAIALAGASLAGCSSFSMDSFRSAPSPIQVPLDSVPPGADAVTSVGPGCKTPCTVSVVAPDSGFSVTFNLPKYQPATIPVQVIRNPGDFSSPASTTLDPNPVVAELQPAGPPPRAARKRVPRKPKAAAAPAGTAAPDPTAAVQPPR